MIFPIPPTPYKPPSTLEDLHRSTIGGIGFAIGMAVVAFFGVVFWKPIEKLAKHIWGKISGGRNDPPDDPTGGVGDPKLEPQANPNKRTFKTEYSIPDAPTVFELYLVAETLKVASDYTTKRAAPIVIRKTANVLSGIGRGGLRTVGRLGPIGAIASAVLLTAVDAVADDGSGTSGNESFIEKVFPTFICGLLFGCDELY